MAMKVNLNAAPAPKDKCRCAVCKTVRQNIDLTENYARYLAGELVSRSAKQ
jgi:hypothetical protein